MVKLHRRSVVLFVLVVAIGATGQDADRAAGKITAAGILERNVIATGGREAHQRLQTFTAQGDFGLSPDRPPPWKPQGHFSFSYAAPSNCRLEVKNDAAWMEPEWRSTLWTGQREGQRFSGHSPELQKKAGAAADSRKRSPGQMELFEEDWLSIVDWDFSSRYDKIELIGQEKVDKKLAYAVQFTPRRGDPVVRYYDPETFLMVGMDQVQRFRQSKDDPEIVYRIRSFFREYRNHDGLKLPQVISVRTGVHDLLFQITKIEPNAKIDNSVFQ